VSSANSSDADAPPVITSETRRLEVGHGTAAAMRLAAAGDPGLPEPTDDTDSAMARNRAN
jgi:hypothetical protein